MNHTTHFQEQFLKYYRSEIIQRKKKTDKILPHGYFDISWLQKRLHEKISFYNDASPEYIFDTLNNGANDALDLYMQYFSSNTRNLIVQMLEVAEHDVYKISTIRNELLSELRNYWVKEIGRTLPDSIESTYDAVSTPTFWNIVKFFLPNSNGSSMRDIIMKELDFDSILEDIDRDIENKLIRYVSPSFAQDIGER